MRWPRGWQEKKAEHSWYEHTDGGGGGGRREGAGPYLHCNHPSLSACIFGRTGQPAWWADYAGNKFGERQLTRRTGWGPSATSPLLVQCPMFCKVWLPSQAKKHLHRRLDLHVCGRARICARLHDHTRHPRPVAAIGRWATAVGRTPRATTSTS
eukprot:scaffold190022_cov35-Tisochrysis_lutea.AAC.3